MFCFQIQDGEDNFTGADELTYDVSIFKSLETLTVSYHSRYQISPLKCDPINGFIATSK